VGRVLGSLKDYRTLGGKPLKYLTSLKLGIKSVYVPVFRQFYGRHLLALLREVINYLYYSRFPYL
jgi:hypothetical protein